MKKKPKALDFVEKWLKDNFEKGEFVEVFGTSYMLIITRKIKPKDCKKRA